jgi:hypothetical protein
MTTLPKTSDVDEMEKAGAIPFPSAGIENGDAGVLKTRDIEAL